MPIQKHKIIREILKNMVLGLLTVSLGASIVLAQEGGEEVGTKCEDRPEGSTEICVELLEPLEGVEVLTATSGVELIENYISAIYKWAAGLVGIVAVLNMVISGIQITTSADSDRAASAKTRIIQSIVALCILFISGLILYTVNPTFFVQNTAP